MMYTIILDEGVVLRDSDGVQIAPCQSDHDPDFMAYNAWVEAGGEPAVLDTRS
jgi:hypothetical protein